MANEENRDDSDGSFHHAQMSPLELGINGSSHSPDIETMVQAASEEYHSIDQTLDEIDTWMTKLEQQNDNLFSELEEFLESSRQARKESQQQVQDPSEQKPQTQQGEPTEKESSS